MTCADSTQKITLTFCRRSAPTICKVSQRVSTPLMLGMTGENVLSSIMYYITAWRIFGFIRYFVLNIYLSKCRMFFSKMFYPLFVVSNCLIATTPVRAQERRRLKVMRPPIPNQAALLLNTAQSNPSRPVTTEPGREPRVSGGTA